ncbi:MAG: phosphotransferase [Saprospirales bacterium]|nr:phosphotransferase [Saprospirales bacterium]MBK8489535.1 phosphotransferase [Saprospirales bacterium]
MQMLSDLYTSWAGSPPDKITPILHASASHRRYFRLEGKGGTAIGTQYDNAAENAAFLYLSRHFKEKGLPVPKILLESNDHLTYLQEDLGTISLYDQLVAANFTLTSALHSDYRLVVELLAALQIKGHEGLDYRRCLSKEGFGKQEMTWDLSYFKYYFLKLLDIPFDEYALERDFEALSNWLDTARPHFFMHRDFQSRNILLPGGQPHFIDFQGGRKGPLQYDLVSLLWQAKANLPQEVRNVLFEHYLDVISQYLPIDRTAFAFQYYGFALLRGLQVLGAYGLRGLVEKKSHFLESIPFALQNIQWLLEHVEFPAPFTELKKALGLAIQKPLPLKPGTNVAQGHPLTILVQSFSYIKGGIPVDESGHGGGFVFDCRGIENPGRLEQYRMLTGRSPKVIEFLQRESNMDPWLEHVFSTVSETVENYLARNLAELSISFGCTGGQHRSVYAADRMAFFLEKKYGVKVVLRHTQEANWPTPQ